MAQGEDKSTLPYYQIPDYPEKYTAGTVAARMIDGLGFRYYWATEGLRDVDLKFKPNENARTTEETLDHILGLTRTIVNATTGTPNERSDQAQLSFGEKRRLTLENIKKAGDILRTCDTDDMDNFKAIFSTSEFPFWNLLNGPIADVLWHVGQVVSFRRSSGNPLNPKVSVFSGRLRQ